LLKVTLIAGYFIMFSDTGAINVRSQSTQKINKPLKTFICRRRSIHKM